MKVFISWSGPKSRQVAEALKSWIPYVIQGAKPFVSAGDIEKGRRWSDVLGEELSESSFGIICITKDNVNAPWLYFEAGAISKAIDNSYVSPFLFNVEPSKIPGPFQQFQFTVYDPDDLLRLMRSINNRLAPENRLTEELLKREFDSWLPELKAKLDEIAKSNDGETQTGYTWLYTSEDLTVLNQRSDCKCVWWITPDLFKHALSPRSKESIKTHLQGGTHYSFVVPASDETDTAAELLRRLAAKPDALHINPIPSDDFSKVAVTDYVILDPDSESLQVFLELPIDTAGYWIKVEYSAATSLVQRFRTLAQKEKPAASRTASPTP